MVDTSKDIVLETLERNREYWIRCTNDATDDVSRRLTQARADAFTDAIQVLHDLWGIR